MLVLHYDLNALAESITMSTSQLGNLLGLSFFSCPLIPFSALRACRVKKIAE